MTEPVAVNLPIYIAARQADHPSLTTTQGRIATSPQDVFDTYEFLHRPRTTPR